SCGKVAAKEAVNAQLAALTGKQLEPEVIDRAFADITLSVDPVAATFPQLAKDAVTAGIAKQAADVAGIADLAALNDVLKQARKPQVDAAGLDHK
ncbi:MAG TPA: sulfonate ABC transporter substrate-binding protein, partial [Kribbellaceae bacterium]|nr:sulfonate ABC transporter substrate-binding protein [Kribbellaceae bacterium]